MCLVCIDLVKQNMTILEADRNLSELVAFAPTKRELRHYKELKEALEELDEDILKTYFDKIEETV
jgi:hypothetical protein